MRELKFRAYIKPLKRYATGLDTIQFHKCCDVEGAGIWSVVTINEGIFECDDIILEQYTGLKDKNGKEIYEGDIVEAPIYGVWTTGNSDAIFGDKIWKLLVIWSDADCGFLFKVIGSKNQPNRVYDILDQHLGAFEVIGNIHENPELLGEEEE